MFEGKTILITGASSGLGEGLGRRFLEERADLALAARSEDKLSRLREELRSRARPDQRVEIFPCDVSDPAQIEHAIARLVETMGPPDMLINNAGILEEGYFESLPLSTFRETFDINYFGALHCTKAVLPHFMQRGTGRIVNIASLGGKIASFGYSAYASSKFALVGLTEVLRLELAPKGIGVTLVCPGEFESPMVEKLNTYRTRENALVTHTVPVLPLATVVEEIVSGLAKERYLIIPGRTARLLELANRWFPSLFRRIADARLARIYRGPTTDPARDR
jgi:3-dehydrosphinganine reductase